MAAPPRAPRPRPFPPPALVLGALLLAGASPARATRLTVTNANDAFAGSLRQQVLDSAPGDTIVFAPAVWGQAITLASGEIAVAHTLTLLGPQHDLLVIRGTVSSRLFNVTGGTFRLGGLALADAFVDGGGFPGGLILCNGAGVALEVSDCYLANGRGTVGGLIDATLASVQLTRCTLNAGVAAGASSFGGAVAASGPVTATDCLFFGNQANGCGGAALVAGTATFVRCTFTQNTAPSGGALCVQTSTASLTDCTIAGNTGGGIQNDAPGATSLKNCVVAGNSGFDVVGAFQSLGYDMVGNGDQATGLGLPGSHDQVGTAQNPLPPSLGALQENGGPTWTMLPNAGSLAVDQGHATAGTADARGHARTYDDPGVVNANGGDGTDVGAVEAGPPTRFEVSDPADDGPGTLRRATVVAAAGDTITFRSDLAGTIRLTSGELFAKRGFVVRGPGPQVVTVDGGDLRPVLDLFPNVQGVSVSGLGFAHGGPPACVWVRGGASLFLDLAQVADSRCLGVENDGVLDLWRSLVTRCNASGLGLAFPRDAGGLLNSGLASLLDCTFAADTGLVSGAVRNLSTGGLFLYGCTIAGNHALSTSPGADGGGGLANAGGAASLTSTLVAGNTAGVARPDVYGPLNTGGYNLVGVVDGSTGLVNGLNHDQAGTGGAPLSAQLGSLADNGGSTRTFLPLAGSPAIDRGTALSAGTDQRGRARIYDDPAVANASDGCDVGACERGAATVDVGPAPGSGVGPGAGADRIDAVAPNPAAGAWRVRFTLARAGLIDLAVFDVAGRRVYTVAAGPFAAGAHELSAGVPPAGPRLRAGVYWLRLATPAGAVARRVVRID